MLQAGGRAVFVTVSDHKVVDQMGWADFTVWVSDGTAEGTFRLASFNDVGNLEVKQVGDKVAFAVVRRSAAGMVDTNVLTDAELYFTDGTTAGTTLVKTFLASASVPTSFGIGKMAVAGDRLIFSPDDQKVWATDGTAAGTIDLTPALSGQGIFSLSVIPFIESGGKVVIPGGAGGTIYVTNGTLAGTIGKTLPDGVQGMPENYVVSGNKVYFTDASGSQKNVWSFDLDTGALKQLFISANTSGGSVIPAAIGDRAFAIQENLDWGAGAKLYALGDSGPTKIADIPGTDILWIREVHTIDGALYFVATHYLGDPTGDNPVPIGKYRAELWRSDGTAAGTGKVKTLYGDIPYPDNRIEINSVRGKIAIKYTFQKVVPAEVINGVPYHTIAETGTRTDVYDPNELMVGRSTTSARMVNGVLRLGGSVGDDRIRVWRSVKMPGRLVVEHNGSFRSFPFNDIRKIIADLQSGNDYFEIIEGEGGQVRTRTSIFGGDGMDTIITGVGRDTISGGDDGDLIRSRGNADEIMGGAGKDRINGGNGDDSIAGGTGNDSIIAAAGVDVLFGQSVIEAIFGQEHEPDSVREDVLLA
jgi:Ca2+-binding RTX toxin-like protein